MRAGWPSPQWQRQRLTSAGVLLVAWMMI